MSWHFWVIDVLALIKYALKQGRGEVAGLVFNNGRVNREMYIQRQHKRILKKAGLRYIKFHGLRHTFCTHLLSNGISPYYVSKQVGHSTIAITCDTYGSWISSSETRHVNTLDSMHQSDPYTHLEGYDINITARNNGLK